MALEFINNITSDFNTDFIESTVGFNFEQFTNKTLNPFDTQFSTAWFVMATLFVLVILSLVTVAIMSSVTETVGDCCCGPSKTRNKVDKMEMSTRT